VDNCVHNTKRDRQQKSERASDRAPVERHQYGTVNQKPVTAWRYWRASQQDPAQWRLAVEMDCLPAIQKSACLST
jgi:hypothetical protein